MPLPACLVALLCLPAPAVAQMPTQPPPTRRVEVRETLHGVEIVDPYRWLEDQTSPETRAWIDAQNHYTDSSIGALPVRKRIEARLARLLHIDSTGVPRERGGRYFLFRRRADQEQPILYWRQGLRGKDRVLVDPIPLSADHMTSVSLLDVTRDGRRVAYALRQGGDDQVEVRIRDVDAGRDLPDRLPRSYIEGLSFTRDGAGFYFTRLRPLVGRRVTYHALGTDPAADREVFGQGYGPEIGVGGEVSENGRWLLLSVYRGWSQSDVFVQDLQSGGPIRPVVTGQQATFAPSFAGDRLLVLTDYKAPKRRVLEADLSGTPPDAWREVVPPGDDPIESFSACGGRLFVTTSHEMSSRVRIFDLGGRSAGDLPLPGVGYVTGLTGRWDSDEAFFQYCSYTTPWTGYRYEVATGRRTEWSRLKAPFRPSDFVVRLEWYASRDGTRVPMFLVHRKGLRMDGARPTLLTGYGGFAASTAPYFSSQVVLWVENGGVYAEPGLRGGAEFGEEWHRAGMLGRKQNVFDDFIAAAEWLVAQKITRPDRLAISGGSNGGLLVGAALTQRPELFRAVVCAVPLLDMLRYHKFLQGPQWVPEYGSADDPQAFRWLYAYSPYHHVASSARYPSVLFTTGDSDTRVAPLHARKMTALLQSLPNQQGPFYLHYETQAGHSGGESVSKQISNSGLVYAYLFHQLGLDGR